MRFRAPVAADAPAVLAVLEARDRADLDEVEYTLGDLVDEWNVSDLDLARHAQVVEVDDGSIVAYGAVRRRGAFVVVAPDHEGRGIGSRLSSGPNGAAPPRRRQDEAVGWVHILAVVPEHQGRGLGTAMLEAAFAGFAEAGLREARLGVASYNDRGLRVYERVGMVARYRFDVYERPAGPRPSRGR